METPVVMLGFLVALWLVHLWMFPWLTGVVTRLMRAVTRLVRWMGRRGMDLGWRVPVGHIGVAKTLWMWGVAAAVLVTVGSCMEQDSRLTAGNRVVGIVLVWAMVLGTWWLLRWWARRTFRPRDLPQRRR